MKIEFNFWNELTNIRLYCPIKSGNEKIGFDLLNIHDSNGRVYIMGFTNIELMNKFNKTKLNFAEFTFIESMMPSYTKSFGQGLEQFYGISDNLLLNEKSLKGDDYE